MLYILFEHDRMFSDGVLMEAKKELKILLK